MWRQGNSGRVSMTLPIDILTQVQLPLTYQVLNVVHTIGLDSYYRDVRPHTVCELSQGKFSPIPHCGYR